MPQRNKRQLIGVIGGSGSGSDEPYLPSAVPDISFSDTSLPVFTDRFRVDGNWNIPVNDFGQGDLTISDSTTPTGIFEGEVILTFTRGSNSCSFFITFPPNKKGDLRVEVKRNSVVSAQDNITTGPTEVRAFDIEFDTTVQAEDAGSAELYLNSHAGSVFRETVWNQRFTWTKDVGGFGTPEDDITVNVVDGDTGVILNTGTATKGLLTQDPEDNKIYHMPIALTGEGFLEVTVNRHVAETALGYASPPGNVVNERFEFDANVINFAIVDGEGNAVDILHTETVNIDNIHPEMPDGGGSFLSVSDIIVHGEGSGERIYFASQLQRKRSGRNEVSTYHASAGALVSIPSSGGQQTIHKKYTFFRQAARSTVIHRGDLHFFEGSAYIYDGSRQPNFTLLNVGKDMGVVSKINRAGTLETLGLNWRSGFPTGVYDKYHGAHLGTFLPMISHDDDLHIISQKENFFDIEGVQWIVYGKKLNQRIPLLRTNGRTGFDVLEELARLTNSIIGFSQGSILFKSRDIIYARLSSDLSSAETTLEYKNKNRDFDEVGTVFIGGEVISYESLGTSSMGVLSRGLHGTTAKLHNQNDFIVKVDNVINAVDLKRPVNEMDINTDITKVINSVITRYAENQVPRYDFLSFSKADAESINRIRKENEYELDLPLDYHQSKWAIIATNNLLGRNKQEQEVITLHLKADFELEIADIVYLNEPIIIDIRGLYQVMQISYNEKLEETVAIVVKIPETPLNT